MPALCAAFPISTACVIQPDCFFNSMNIAHKVHIRKTLRP